MKFSTKDRYALRLMAQLADCGPEETLSLKSVSESYAAAGVDVTAGYKAVELMKAHVARTNVPDGLEPDAAKACSDYDQIIENAGGIDLQLLGLGHNGHIGFNEPLSSLASRTRDKALTPTTIAQNAPLFPRPEDMPKRALTMGVGTILEAKRILMLVTGAEKAEIIAKAVEGPITSMVSATALQLHRKCTVIVDESAAELLQGKDYYRWIFRNEPEWQIHQDLLQN